MTKQDMDGRLTDRKITLPLNQTVFLPKTAMGVRYIDKVGATVFIDKVQRSDEKIWLRGFYELDLEYQGLEGRGLNKYRVMLPLKAELPTAWLGNLQYEAADLHAVISKPTLKILSPYVLEFAGTMRLEYVGEHLWQEDKLDYCPKPAIPRRVWRSDVPMPDADMAELRLESKIDRFFLGRQGDKPMPPRLVTMNEELPPSEQPPRRRQNLPVWPGGGQADDKTKDDKMQNEKMQYEWQGDLVKSGHWVGLNDRNMTENTHTHQAGDEMTENGGHKLPVWQPQMSKKAATNEEIERRDGENTHKLPVWRFTVKPQTKDEEYSAEKLTEKLTEKMAENLEETAAAVNTEAETAETLRVDNEKTVAETVQAVEKAVEKPMEKPVEKPVETIVHKKWENYRQTQEQIYAPPLGKNKFRSLLTGAALSRMQARGESLQAEADYARVNNVGWTAELPKMNEKVAEDVTDAAADERREDAVTDMSKKLLEEVRKEIKADIAAADVTQEDEVQVGEAQEVAAENTAEAEITAAEVVAEQTAVTESEAAAESTEEVIAEEAAEVITEVITEEVGEKAAEAVAESAANGQPQVAAEAPGEPDIKQGVRMVNNSGVRLRMAAAKQNRAESKPVSAGRSNAPTTPGKGFAMKYYVVKAGDEPMGIALKHNVSLESLLAANRLQNGELPVGTVLRIPV